MFIRLAQEDDAEQLAQAEYDTAASQEGLLAAKPHEIPISAFRSKIKQLRVHGLYVVMESQGQLVGHLILEPLGLSATKHVSQLTIVVHPGHTGRGYGKALMEYAIDWARKSTGVEKIELRVRSTNHGAIGLYESLGFSREGRLKKRIKLQQGYADDICMALFVDGATAEQLREPEGRITRDLTSTSTAAARLRDTLGREPKNRPVSGYTCPEHLRSALITIDVQCDTLDGAPFEVPGTSAILPRIEKLAEAFRCRALPIVHVVRLYKPDGSNVDLCRRDRIQQGASLVIAGSPGSQIAPRILRSPVVELDSDLLLRRGIQEVGPQEWIIYKPRWGAFFETPLESHLRHLGVSTLVFTGCNFPNCPRTSIYEASERDFRIVAVGDAISGFYDRGRLELENIGVLVVDTESYLKGVAA